MMKIEIITLHAINNYGSVFQTYATERIFKDLGYDVETIDYIRETAQLNSIRQIIKYGGPGIKLKTKQILSHLFLEKNKRAGVLQEFREKYLHLTPQKYLSDQDFA